MGHRGNRRSGGGHRQHSRGPQDGPMRHDRDERVGHDPRSRVDQRRSSYQDEMRRMFLGETADVTIVLRTGSGDVLLEELLKKLDEQTGSMHTEILAVDSDSQDRTPLILRSRGIRSLHAEKGADYFDEAMRVAEADTVVFMTQDSLPLSNEWLEQLTLPIRYSENVAMVHGRLLADASVPPYHRGLINAQPYASGKRGLIFHKDSQGEGAQYMPSTNFAVSRKRVKAAGLLLDDRNLLDKMYPKGLAKVYLPEPVSAIRTPKLLPGMLALTEASKPKGSVPQLLGCEAKQMFRELDQLNSAGALPNGERGEAYAIAIALHSTRMADLMLAKVDWIRKAADSVAPVARKLLPGS